MKLLQKHLFIVLLPLLYLLPRTGQSQLISGVINDYYSLGSIDSCANSLTLSSTSGLSAGDKILIIQMQGATIDVSSSSSFGTVTSLNRAGLYEFNVIQSVNGNEVILAFELANSYDPGANTQVVRVPVYSSPTITGTLLAQPWNGSTGGIIALQTSGNVTLNADIDATGAGFRGGQVQTHPACANAGIGGANDYFCATAACGGAKGEGITVANPSYGFGRGAYANGGGGGNDHNAGGGGGGNAGLGGTGGERYSGFFSCPGPYPGMGGKGVATTTNLNRVFLGGGGGAGDDNNGVGTPGANGGGIIFIIAGSISGNGHAILANGDSVATDAGADGAGGGGAGGTIILDIGSSSGLTVEAKGGKGGDTNNDFDPSFCMGPGGGGGGGLIAFVNTFSGSFSVAGGASGMTINSNAGVACAGSSNGATAGATGDTIVGVQVVESVIPFNPNFAQITGDTVICAGHSATLNASGGVSYSWAPSAGIPNPNDSSIQVSPLNTTTYTVTATSSNGCSDTATITVDVNPPSSPAGISGDTTICAGGTATLTASGGVSYSWAPASGIPDPNDSTIQTSPTATTTYTVTTTDVNGCSDTATSTVFVNPPPAPTAISGDTSICLGESLILFIDGVDSAQFTPAVLPLPNIIGGQITPAVTTTYTAVAYSNGCSGTFSMTVNVIEVTAGTGNDTTIQQGETSILNGSTNIASGTFVWEPDTDVTAPGSLSTTATPSATTVYTLTVTSPEGCTGTDSVTVFVEISSGSGAFIVPNAFSPNNDGLNDIFLISHPSIAVVTDLFIFNRWGEKIYDLPAPSPVVSWDGTTDGVAQPIGAYAYYLRYTDTSGNEQEEHGNITILR